MFFRKQVLQVILSLHNKEHAAFTESLFKLIHRIPYSAASFNRFPAANLWRLVEKHLPIQHDAVQHRPK